MQMKLRCDHCSCNHDLRNCKFYPEKKKCDDHISDFICIPPVLINFISCDNLCSTKICGWLSDWLRLTKESTSRVQPCLLGRCTGSFPEQRLVIEPNNGAEIDSRVLQCYHIPGKYKRRKFFN